MLMPFWTGLGGGTSGQGMVEYGGNLRRWLGGRLIDRKVYLSVRHHSHLLRATKLREVVLEDK